MVAERRLTVSRGHVGKVVSVGKLAQLLEVRRPGGALAGVARRGPATLSYLAGRRIVHNEFEHQQSFSLSRTKAAPGRRTAPRS